MRRCGAVNGALIAVGQGARARRHARHAVHLPRHRLLWASGQQINAADLPHGFLTSAPATSSACPSWPCSRVAVVLARGYYLRSYRSGRELYAIGSDPVAARAVRHPGRPQGLRRVRLLSGALAGLAGVLYAARFGTLDANAGHGLGAQRRRRGRRRRCRHLRRQRHGLRRRARRGPAHHHHRGAARPGRQHRSGSGPSIGALILAAIAPRPVLAAAPERRLRGRRRSHPGRNDTARSRP